MPKQKGIVKIKGTMGDMTFYKTMDGYLVKERTSLDKAKIQTDASFQRTRENGREFGEAAKSGKLLRDALHTFMLGAKDPRVVSRLTKLMGVILRMDPTNVRGSRLVGTAIALPAAMGLLQGFNFNIKAILSEVLLKPFAINTVTGVITINGLVPLNDVTPPQGATHVSFTGCWAKVDFAGRVFNVQISNAVNLHIDATLTNVILTPAAAPTGAGTNIYLLKAQFFQLVNGLQYVLKNGKTNALSIVAVA